MALFIKPPSGYFSFSKLYNFVMKRVVFLYYVHGHSVNEITKIIELESLAENSECLMEGTVKDKISHFTLRFLCASDHTLQHFLLQSETKLFEYRLKFSNILKLRQILQKAYKQSQYILQSKCYILKSFKQVLESVIHVAEEVEVAVKNECSFIRVHFSSALKFVEKRSHVLHNGYIKLPIKDLKILLIYLFEETLFEGLNQMKTSQCMKELKDPRMSYMHQKIKIWLLSKLRPKILRSQKFVKESSIASESFKFPLCMQNLHNQLSKHHRLKHLSRIHYTLFLKEIGVPCSDVINLFMREYSTPAHSCQDGHCSHNWIDSEKRYIYSIQHLYGMRGACRNYKAHSCHSLQSTYDSQGGCPFVTFDDQHLRQTLENQCFELKDIEDIISMAHKEKYQDACSFYLVHKARMNPTTEKYFSNHYSEKNMENGMSSLRFQSYNSICHDSTSTEGSEKYSISSMPLNITSPCDFYTNMSFYVSS